MTLGRQRTRSFASSPGSLALFWAPPHVPDCPRASGPPHAACCEAHPPLKLTFLPPPPPPPPPRGFKWALLPGLGFFFFVCPSSRHCLSREFLVKRIMLRLQIARELCLIGNRQTRHLSCPAKCPPQLLIFPFGFKVGPSLC